MDDRFDRVYLLKTRDGELDRVKQLCLDYDINDNDVFLHAASFHFAWGIGPEIFLLPHS